MDYKSCLQKQADLIEVFAPFQTPEAKYEKIIELGRSLTPLSPEYRTPDNLVKGCQSKLYLRSFYIPKWIQKLEFCQSQRPRFKPIEAAPIQLDRSDGEGVKDGDADAGKNQFLSLLGYRV